MKTNNYSEEISRIESNITSRIVKENDEDLYIQEPLSSFLAKEFISWILIIAFAFGISLIINKFIVESTEVIGESMLPTFKPGEKLLLNKFSYVLGKPKRGDLVVFLPDNEGKNYIKRIIALPGETIDIKDGKVYINGELLDESLYLTDSVVTNQLYNGKDFPYTLGSEEYFAMGDNRGNSFDCRSEEIGALTVARMRGKVLMRIFPLEEFQIFTSIKYNNNRETIENK